MMKSMRLLDRLDPPIALDFMGKKRILNERLMRTKFIVIIFMAPQNITKMWFIHDNKLIDALSANRADQARSKRLPPW